MATRNRISFASCNLYNLNLPGRPMYRDADGWSEAEFEAKLGWFSQALNWVDADVWGFQELWNANALAAVFERAGLSSAYELLSPPDHDGRSIVNALALRRGLRVGEPEWIEDFPEKFRLLSEGDDAQTPAIAVNLAGFSRPVLHLQLRPRPNAAAIELFVVHLKSKRPAEVFREAWFNADRDFYGRHSQALGAALSTIRRTAEAAALRMMITEIAKDSDRPVVVLGDLNDGQRSNTQDILTGDPNYLLSGDVPGGSDVALYAAQTLQNYRSQRDVYYTYIHQNQHESLDHVLVSQEFYDNSKKRIWAFDGMDVYNDHLNFGDPKRHGSTDHGIVKVSFRHRPR